MAITHFIAAKGVNLINVYKTDENFKLLETNDTGQTSSVLVNGLITASNSFAESLGFNIGQIQSKNKTLSIVKNKEIIYSIIFEGNKVPNEDIKRLIKEFEKFDRSGKISDNDKHFKSLIKKIKINFDRFNIKEDKVSSIIKDSAKEFDKKFVLKEKLSLNWTNFKYKDEFKEFLSNLKVIETFTLILEKNLKNDEETSEALREGLKDRVPKKVKNEDKEVFISISYLIFLNFLKNLGIDKDKDDLSNKINLLFGLLQALTNFSKEILEAKTIFIRFYKKNFFDKTDSINWKINIE